MEKQESEKFKWLHKGLGLLYMRATIHYSKIVSVSAGDSGGDDVGDDGPDDPELDDAIHAQPVGMIGEGLIA